MLLWALALGTIELHLEATYLRTSLWIRTYTHDPRAETIGSLRQRVNYHQTLRYSHKNMFVASMFYLLALFGVPNVSANHDDNRLVLYLLDGMRWDLFGLDLPALKKVEETGVKADWLEGVFITMTIPSTFSIATGLYPESHGALHNAYFNLETSERTYTFQDTLNVTEWFNQGNAEPIWVTAINQGLKAGVIMYPGCNIEINGVLPTKRVVNAPWYWDNYSTRQGVEDAISWLKDDDFDLVVIYSNTPDFPLHGFGIGDQRATDSIIETDGNVGYLFERLESEGLADVTNVILASDHGHVNLDPKKAISIYDYVYPEDIQMLVADYGPVFELEPNDGLLDKVFEALDGAHPNMHVFKREDFPQRFHYANNPRHLKIIGYADAPWEFFANFSSGEHKIYGSSHGFDNQDEDMRSIFYAKGPRFKQGYQKEHFESVNIYMLMCELLELDAAPNNGSRANYADMIEPANSVNRVMSSGPYLSIASTVAVVLYYTI